MRPTNEKTVERRAQCQRIAMMVRALESTPHDEQVVHLAIGYFEPKLWRASCGKLWVHEYSVEAALDALEKLATERCMSAKGAALYAARLREGGAPATNGTNDGSAT